MTVDLVCVLYSDLESVLKSARLWFAQNTINLPSDAHGFVIVGACEIADNTIHIRLFKIFLYESEILSDM